MGSRSPAKLPLSLGGPTSAEQHISSPHFPPPLSLRGIYGLSVLSPLAAAGTRRRRRGENNNIKPSPSSEAFHNDFLCFFVAVARPLRRRPPPHPWSGRSSHPSFVLCVCVRGYIFPPPPLLLCAIQSRPVGRSVAFFCIKPVSVTAGRPNANTGHKREKRGKKEEREDHSAQNGGGGDGEWGGIVRTDREGIKVRRGYYYRPYYGRWR